jgi:hypothetical protein
MPAAVPTRADLQRQLVHARAAMILAEDNYDLDAAQQARELCDRILDQLSEQPEPK